MLEPVTQQLQAVDMDMMGVRNQISLLLKILRSHRDNAEQVFSQDVIPEAKTLAGERGIDLIIPQRCARQAHRPNVEGTLEEYYRSTIYVPYIDSMIQSLESRFGESNQPYYHIFALHPKEIQQRERSEFKRIISSITQTYEIDNLMEEALTWYDVHKHNPPSNNCAGLIELVKQTSMFPAVRKAILIALTLPATSCTAERSFSTLRRVKTWLRSTMSDKRLSSLCMLSVHRDKVSSQKTEIMNKVIDKFRRNPRRLQFLFQE